MLSPSRRGLKPDVRRRRDGRDDIAFNAVPIAKGTETNLPALFVQVSRAPFNAVPIAKGTETLRPPESLGF